MGREVRRCGWREARRSPPRYHRAMTAGEQGGGAAERWLRVVPSLRDPQLRIRFVRTELEVLGLAEAAGALEAIAASTEQTDPRAREVLIAAAPTLTDPAWELRLEALRAEASREGHLALCRLLRRRVPSDLGPTETTEPQVAMSARGRPLTLGERKAYARKPDRFMLDRLLRDHDPSVIRNVLGNPRITEEDVLRLAARRPNFAEVIEEVIRHARWSGSVRVRLAVVLNPYTPTSVSVPLVPLLLRQDLQQVTEATTVPAVVRAAAVELLQRRPPIRSDAERSGLDH